MLQVREKSYSRLLKTHAPGIYLETRWYSFLCPPLDAIPVEEGFIGVLLCCYLETRWYSFLRPLNTVPVKEGFSPSVVVLLPVFPFTVFLAQCCLLRTEFRSSFVQKLAHQIDDLLDQTS